MPKPTRSLIAAPIVFAAAVGSWLYLHRGQLPPALADWLHLPHHHAAASPVLTLYGDVDIREVQPAFEDGGRITAMWVHEGAVVRRGQLLAMIDPARAAARLAEVQAQMRNKKATLDKLLAGSRPQEIAQAKATMDALHVTSENDGITWRRYAQLAITNAGTLQQRDDAEATYESTNQRYEAAKQAYLLAVAGARPEDIAAARAAYQAAVAAVSLARRELDDTMLYAPADGVVEDRILEPGDMASPATPVYTIALENPLWVRAYVPEADLGRTRLGLAATVTTDSYPGHRYHGWIGYISPVAEFTPKTVETPTLRTALVYQVRVYVCDTRGELRLGMPATVHIDLRQPASAAQAGCGTADAARP
jgi:membrane fusion protein YbhG